MEKVTHVLGTQVISENGERLGRVFDLRSEGEPEHGAPANDRVITELLYETQGILERLGLKKRVAKSIPWQAVKRIEGKTIVVVLDSNTSQL